MIYLSLLPVHITFIIYELVSFSKVRILSASIHGGTATSAEMKLFKDDDDGKFRDILRDEPAYIVKDGSGTGNRDKIVIG